MIDRRMVAADWAMRVLIVAFVAILLVLPFHAFISTWGGAAVGQLLVWKSWKEILLLILVPVVIGYCILRPDIAKKVWASWLLRLIAGYVVLHGVYALTTQASFDATIAGLLMNLRFLALFVLGYLIAASNHPWVKVLWAWAPKALFAIVIMLSLLAIAQVTLLPKDFLVQFGYGPATVMPYTVIDDQPDAVRAQATLDGPNPLGAYLVIGLAACIVFIAKQKSNLFAGLSLGLGVFALMLTSSRSAWLGFGAAMGVLILTLMPRRALLAWVKWGTIPLILLVAGFLWAAMTVPALRLAVFHSTMDRPSLTTGSSDKHWFEVTNGLIDVSNNPLGYGVGTAGPASIYNDNNHPKLAENYYVQLAQEVGLPGLVLFCLISIWVAYALWHQRRAKNPWGKALLASFVGIAAINLFLHGWTDDPTAMTWWGIAGLYLGGDNKK